MRVSDGVRRFALDQLSGVPGLRAKAMFGGIGLYADDVFFGILAADVLFFKVGDSNRHAYEAAGSKPFKPYPGRSMTMSYYEVPVAVLEDASTLTAWAERAVAAAKALKTVKATPKTLVKSRTRKTAR
jgi:DNA transformation protein and related proteins